ncbi:magnesium chelatase subunit H [Oxobacter pfennigii]|uniref:magnesium chelatase subunit H n=1 Tax=Oxobacter pfennigii TaxID=36849 RepID=UPI0006D48F8A|nr:magnesium chelatase subunit H [Oxobacter pfennigii]
MKLVVVTVSNVVLSDMVNAAREINQKWPDSLSLKLYYAGKALSSKKMEDLKENLKGANMIIVDLMGAPNEIREFILKTCINFKKYIVPINGENSPIRSLLKLGTLTAEDLDMNRLNLRKENDYGSMMKMLDVAEKVGNAALMGKMKDMKNYMDISKYMRSAGEDDVKNMLYLILRDYGKAKGIPEPKEPSVAEDTGICRPHDRKYYLSFEKFAEENPFDSAKPTVAIFFYGHSYPNRTSKCVAQIAQRIGEFANILPVAFSSASSKNIEGLKSILDNAGGQKVNLIINFMSFRLSAGPMGGDAQAAVDMLKELNVPVLHPFFMTKREIDEWRNSPQGINPSEFLVSVMLPELDGCIETIPVGAMVKAGAHVEEEYDIELSELSLIEERAEKLVSRVYNWLRLRTKSNCDKKVAIICYNYPPGEDNIFGGAFLDTFSSVENILHFMKDDGYTLECITKEELMDIFAAGKIVNSAKWANEEPSELFIRYGKEEYEKFLFGESFEKEIERQWGKAPGRIMSEGDNFLIPGIINGNIFIGLQPSRGIHENPEKVYHDKSLLPHHQYIAFYHWLKESFKADIIIHVGTHGTLEFLKGKECGMSGHCFPDMLIGDIPHGYIYYAGNPAEAMIAKRRSHAVMISYQPPVFMEGELYGDLLKLESMVNEYHEAQRVQPQRCNDLMERIVEAAENLKLDGNSLQDLEGELYRIKKSLVPRGLHTFGKAYDNDEAAGYMKFILRYDRGEIKSLRRLVAESEGYNYELLMERREIQTLSKLDTAAAKIVDYYIRNDRVPRYIIKDDGLREEAAAALEFGIRAYSSAIECHEHKGFLKVLSGEYLPARLAGDTIRNPEVLPSGYNLYQFDPRMVPGEAAMQRGANIAMNTLEQYKKERGEYPNSTAVILWGLETSRTQGETVGQILHYLGVRVAPKRSLFKADYEIIPLSELGRPRIDVVVNICGFFRDMFPNLIDDLNDIFKRLAELEEPDEQNYFKANTRKIFNKLSDEGYSLKEAEELSYSRIFGPKEGEYGTGISKLIETKNWEGEKQIGEMYVSRLKHVYSKNYRGMEAGDILEAHLEAVDIVSQVRSSHEYEVTDLDHYYEYFGGLSKSVEMAKGKKAAVYITDTTTEKIETETVDKSIARGVRTRLLNPKWIDGMLEHKYHGVQKISDRFENMLGLAASTNKVENWIFSSLNSAYVMDEEMRMRMKENNRWAYFSILETLLECNRRGYWNAEEDEIKGLMDAYLELEGDIEEGI